MRYILYTMLAGLMITGTAFGSSASSSSSSGAGQSSVSSATSGNASASASANVNANGVTVSSSSQGTGTDADSAGMSSNASASRSADPVPSNTNNPTNPATQPSPVPIPDQTIATQTVTPVKTTPSVAKPAPAVQAKTEEQIKPTAQTPDNQAETESISADKVYKAIMEVNNITASNQAKTATKLQKMNRVLAVGTVLLLTVLLSQIIMFYLKFKKSKQVEQLKF